ncbi:MAG: protein kinase [Polyangia bacterium]
MADKYPRPFGRYALLAPLAQGGMGALYLACVGDRGLERLCVIKTVLPHLADPEYVARFRDEAKVVVRLSHGNLVPVFDAGLVGDELYLAMDYVEGKDLRAVWNRCAKKGIAFPVDVAVYIARELSRGLHYAHNFGNIKLVHRDVSPPNVLISFAGEVKLTDFGLASSTLKLEKTAAGIIYGKVSYMSPEQARGELIDGRTDLYAAGIILWELLTGRQLFPQNQNDSAELIERVRNPVIDPPSVRAPRVPPALDRIVMRALAKDKEERYTNAEQFRADLTAFLASNREYVATDAERVRAFLADLFDDDIERERRQRQELLETVHDRLAENQRQQLAEREAAAQKEQRKADILAAMEGAGRKSSENLPQPSKPGEDPIPEDVEQGMLNTDKIVGTVLDGRWRLLRKIGEGGMGRVFEAEHVEIPRRVAIKILHAVYSRTPEVVARFRNEAKAASKIGHPNIVEITDSGTTVDGSFYFVMELLEGVDLAERLKNEQRLPVEESLGIAVQVAQALSAAHQVNIVHRDLKPENIFLIPRDGNPNFVKVLDFGIAKSLSETSEKKLTSHGMAMGTPEYMAPEQAAGKSSDGRADIYSLGAVIYEMLSGRAPIEGENLMEILMRKATEDPVDLSQLRPDAPVAVSQSVMRMLSRTPEARPQSMAEAATELSRLLTDLQAGIVPLAREPVKPTVAANQAGSRRWRLFGAVILSGGLLGVSAALYWVLNPPPPKPVPPDMKPVIARPADAGVPAPRDAGAAVVPARPADLGTPERPSQNPDGGHRTNSGGGSKKPDKLFDGKPTDRVTALGQLEEGRLANASGNSAGAYNICRSAGNNPDVRGQALVCMGDAEFGRGRYSEAVKLGKMAIKERASSKEVYLLLGKAYLKQKNCKDAKIYFSKIINGSDPTNPEALKGLELCK